LVCAVQVEDSDFNTYCKLIGSFVRDAIAR
jgi:hypothetical protein